MTERTVLVQVVTIQRAERPTGLRLLSDGAVQRGSGTLPNATEPLEKDRTLDWTDSGLLNDDELNVVRAAIRQGGFFDLEPRLLINYCKDDPGVAIWTVNLDDRQSGSWSTIQATPQPDLRRAFAGDQRRDRVRCS